MNQDIRNLILELVASGPIKGVELAAKVAKENALATERAEDSCCEYHNTIETMVDDGEIIEVEYTLPTLDYCIKSLYFPAGTEIEVRRI